MSDADQDEGISGILADHRAEEDGVQLKREVLLAQLFPSQVTRPRLGRYDVLEFVGEGGMGTVFAAYDPRLDRRVAVKQLRRASVGQPQRHARLLREAKALARLSHPNIVTIHEVWEEDDEILLAMEFVEGQDLAKWQQDEHTWSEVLEVYRQAGEGLAAAHAAGLVYRDFKPHNAIRRDADGVVKLLDFGLARVTTDAPEPTAEAEAETAERGDEGNEPTSADHLTRPGAIMGTPAYMAPEQLEGRAADARSDQFSFCAALWEALYGQLPYERAMVAGGVFERRARVEPPRDHGVPSWIRRVLDRGLASAPDERYPSVRALLRDLAADPAVRRRRILYGVAMASAMVAGGLAIAELRAEGPTPCVVPDGPWNEDRRLAVRDGIAAAGGTAADQTWSLLEPRLSLHAESLVSTRRQACEAHRRGLLPDDHYGLQVSCLDRRQAAFDELLTRLGAAEPAAVTNANKAIAELPSPWICTNTQVLLADQLPPDDPEVAQQVDRLREQLARAEAEEAAGLHSEAEERSSLVLEQAQPLSYEPLRAEALLRLGSARMQAGHADSRRRLDEALWVALSTEQRRVAAEAAAKRIYAQVELEDRGADATEAIALARALAERDGASDWRTQWALHNNVAIALERRGEQSAALEAYEDALRRIPDEDDLGAYERAATLLNMAPVQLRLGEPDAAVRGAKEAVEQLTTLFGSEHPQLRAVRTDVASVLRKSGRTREARSTLDRALEQYGDEAPPRWVRLEQIRIARDLGELDDALSLCKETRPTRESPHAEASVWEVVITSMEAELSAMQGDPSSLEALERLAPVVSADQRSDLARGRARALLHLGRASEAERILNDVLASPELDEWARISAGLELGRALVAQERWEEAQRRLAAVLDGQGGPRFVPVERTVALQALSTAELGLGRRQRARTIAEQAVDALRGADPDGEAMRAALATLERARTRPTSLDPH